MAGVCVCLWVIYNITNESFVQLRKHKTDSSKFVSFYANAQDDTAATNNKQPKSKRLSKQL